MAQLLDERKFAAVGEPVAVAEQVALNGNFGQANFSASPNRILAYGGFDYEDEQLTWVDQEGRTLSTIGPRGHYSDLPSVSG